MGKNTLLTAENGDFWGNTLPKAENVDLGGKIQHGIAENGEIRKNTIPKVENGAEGEITLT